jgi:hypothetical protein
LFTRNHVECRAVLGERTFNELDAEASESVFVGHHNFVDAVAFDEVQKCRKTFALKVEAGGDVGDDFVVLRTLFVERVDLSLEVARVLLLRGGDTRVDDDDTGDFFDGSFVFDTEDRAQVLFVVSMA